MKTLLMAGILVTFANIVMGESLYAKEEYPEEYCLALNIYYEARGSNFADQMAVADVVLNRVQDRRYPQTVCNVVYQGEHKPSWKTGNPIPIRNRCQFSWYCDGKPDDPKDTDAWMAAQANAYKIMNYGEFRGLTEGATHYHAGYVNPRWASSLQLVGKIGDHVYYRWND
jgi:spore germination cell wall hydrolase CwlJ-like protein